MKRLTILALAAATLSFSAVPAFAQSSYGGNTGQSYGNTSTVDPVSAAEKAERRALKAAKKQAKKEAKRKAKAEKAAAKGQSSATDAKAAAKGHSSATDAKAAVKGHSSATDAKAAVTGHSSATDATILTRESVTPAASALPTNCPTGTTPQPNGTCMLN